MNIEMDLSARVPGQPDLLEQLYIHNTTVTPNYRSLPVRRFRRLKSAS